MKEVNADYAMEITDRTQEKDIQSYKETHAMFALRDNNVE
jgi:hypothetical protein